MRKPRLGSSELLRLPLDVARAIRRRAARADITLAEAARQLMLPKEHGQALDLPEHARWLQLRLLRSRDELVQVFEDAAVDAHVIDQAIGALNALALHWPEEDHDDFDYATYMQHGL
ncbi:MAG: hypothetical protein Q8R92_06555 [Deltaproteobacteria bacterium]|nr:hypothetical protein [Deltaproteobacteria bacterium]